MFIAYISCIYCSPSINNPIKGLLLSRVERTAPGDTTAPTFALAVVLRQPTPRDIADYLSFGSRNSIATNTPAITKIVVLNISLAEIFSPSDQRIKNPKATNATPIITAYINLHIRDDVRSLRMLLCTITVFLIRYKTTNTANGSIKEIVSRQIILYSFCFGTNLH